MVFTQEQFSSWNVDVLKKYLAERGVPLGGGFRKDDLVKKCMYAQELQLPVQPNPERRSAEIQARRSQKLSIDNIQILLPEEIVNGWIKGSVYYPNVTIDGLQIYVMPKKAILTKDTLRV